MAERKQKYSGHRAKNEDEGKKLTAKIREAAEKNANGRSTNAYEAANDPNFRAACDRAGIKPTARQMSKYRRKQGLAWENRA